MTMHLDLSRLRLRDVALWTAAATAMLAVHVAVAYAVQSFKPLEDEDGGPPPALMLELAPMAVAPAVEEEALVPDEVVADQAEPVETEETAEAEIEPMVDEAEPVETVEPEEMAKAEPLEEEPTQKPEEIEPETIEAITPEVAIPVPQRRPAPPEPMVEKPVEKAKRPPKREKAVKPPSRTAEAARSEAPPAPKAAAPKAVEGVSARRISPVKWQSRVLSWLNRHKRYPSSAKSRREEGNTQVSFTIDASGTVTGSRVVRSSGNADLDRAALDMVRRASPVPAPPKEIARSRMTLSVPVVFNLR
ncbi:energy transducer TonB family protein [Pseudaminobacter sp. NGMCC 1.201702]|uniref:energy transducer TonB family protein n=1 Tax=Pseudaminobacter sp. NGMCC 1.201702 TaxID=3391825 RepID=UPI0039F04658